MQRITVDPRAPALGLHEAVVNAPIDVVWRVLSDFEHWPEWNTSVSRIELDGPARVGTTFEWSAGSSRIVSRIEEVDPPTRLAWSGKMAGIRAIHVWELSRHGSGTRVRTEESFQGWIVKLLAGPMRKVLAKALAQGVGDLAKEAERRARG